MRRTDPIPRGLFALTVATIMVAGPCGPPVVAAVAPGSEAVIVVFHDSVADPVSATAQLARDHGFAADHVYRHALSGFSATLPAQARQALLHNPQVAYITPDSVAILADIQAGATWGLDRIDQRSRTLDGLYHYTATGVGVTAYVIDTGIRLSHTEFDDRATTGFNFLDDGVDECNGHGTHVAGTIGGKTYGVAKGVSLVSVRVFPCIGETPDSEIIRGLEWMIGDHLDGEPAVANMSFSGPINQALDDAVQNVIDDGISVVIAAGNGTLNDWRAVDACGFSPGRVAAAMTMGATTSKDQKASFSNYGPCVDWFAPGASITSAYDWTDTATATMNGTSMATPHTAGVAVLYLEANPSAAPAVVRDALYAATTKGIVKSSRSTNNHLLYSVVDAPS
ncbi:MAG: S8 family peptidase [Candidatus Limnocylindrales bacterium]